MSKSKNPEDYRRRIRENLGLDPKEEKPDKKQPTTQNKR
jgi:hypothetical protein